MFFKVKLTAKALFVNAAMSLAAQGCAATGPWGGGLSLDPGTVFSDARLEEEAGEGKE